MLCCIVFVLCCVGLCCGILRCVLSRGVVFLFPRVFFLSLSAMMQAAASKKKKQEEWEKQELAKIRREKKKEKRERDQKEAKERAFLKEQEDCRAEYFMYGNRSVAPWFSCQLEGFFCS